MYQVVIENEEKDNEKEKKTKLKWSEFKKSKPEDDYYVECKKDRFFLKVDIVRKYAIIATKIYID